MLKEYGDFVSCENSTKNEDEKDGFYLVTKEAKAEGESDTATNAETESAAASSAGIAFGADAVPVIEIRGKLRGGDFLFIFRGRPHSVGA